jgi:hypothetical protein
VRSSNCGQMKRNFRFNSDRVLMPMKLNTLIHKMIPLYINASLMPGYRRRVTSRGSGGSTPKNP